MRVWCLSPPMCWSLSVHDTNGTFLDCGICQRKGDKHYRPTHGIRARPKWGNVNMAHPHQLTKAWKKSFFNNHVPTKCWFCAYDINSCMTGNKKNWLFDWWNLLTMCLVEVGTNLTQEEVFTLEDVGFQLQDREAFSPRCCLGAIPNLSITLITFMVSIKSTCSPHHTVFRDSLL